MPQPKLAADWFRGISKEEDKASLIQAIYSAKGILDIVKELVIAHKNSLEKVSMTDYDSPQWAYKEAHKNGRKEEIDYLLRLLNLDQEV